MLAEVGYSNDMSVGEAFEAEVTGHLYSMESVRRETQLKNHKARMVEKRNQRSPPSSSASSPCNAGASSSPTAPSVSSVEVLQPPKLETLATAQSPSPQLYIETAIRNNFAVLEYCRTVQSAASGVASGCLGLTATWGFLFYFVCVGVQALCWHYKAGSKWSDYFASQSVFITHSLVGGLFTYVLFWVFFYGIVHVY